MLDANPSVTINNQAPILKWEGFWLVCNEMVVLSSMKIQNID